jgi:superfamily II DNA or RNA helicase
MSKDSTTAITKPQYPGSKQKVSPLNLLDFQKEPSAKLTACLEHFYSTGKNTGVLFVMPTRCGKTYVVASALRSIQDVYPLRRYNPYLPSERFLIITPASVKTQFSRVLHKAGVKDFTVTSPTSMSTGFGDTSLSWISIIKNGVMDQEPVWDDQMKPDVIILDECQWVKSHEANISKVIISAVKQGILVIFVSATPFTTLAESFVVSLGLKLCRDNYSHKELCQTFILNHQDYAEPNDAAMKRFNTYLLEKNRKIEAHNIKFLHRVFNKCILIDFQTKLQAETYKKAYDTYIEECTKHNKHTPEGWAAIWVAMLKFRQTAEALRSNSIVLRAIEKVTKEGKQVMIASNFRLTLDVMISMLVEKYSIPRHRIGLIIGGQNIEQRQKDIDNFQRGNIDYFFLTLKSGGAGLSLHHEHKTARPRHVLLPPTWSAIEQVQVLGRAHGPTSLSTTHQEIIWYRGTIEEYVAQKVSARMRSLREMVSKRETWLDLFNPEGSFNVEELGHLQHKLTEETEELTESGDKEVDGLALEAFENETSEEIEII